MNMIKFITAVLVLTLAGLLFHDPATAITLITMLCLFGILGYLIYTA